MKYKAVNQDLAAALGPGVARLIDGTDTPYILRFADGTTLDDMKRAAKIVDGYIPMGWDWKAVQPGKPPIGGNE